MFMSDSEETAQHSDEIIKFYGFLHVFARACKPRPYRKHSIYSKRKRYMIF